MAFPLFDLPDGAVQLVLDPKDKRALRLVCKRSRAGVDRRVVAVKYWWGARAGPPLYLLSSRRPGSCRPWT